MRRAWWLWAGVAAALAVAVVVLAVVVTARPAGHPGPVTAGHATSPAQPSRAPLSSPGATGGPATGTPAAGVAGCAAAAVAGMSDEQRVGQLLMVGTPFASAEDLAGTVRRYHLGGVFLAGRSHQSAAQLGGQIRALQAAASLPLQVATDQEGGEVQALQGADFPPIPSALVQGGWDQATLRSRTRDWAARLHGVGVTLDLAPVADTVPPGTAAANPPIGAFDRQYGSAPGPVAADVRTVVGAMQGAGVLATLKHFPGLGRVRANTDTSTAAVDTTATADDPYLAPFAAGIHAGSGAVMISLARYPRLDPDNVAAFSPAIVTGLLRGRLGFTGLVVSDDLGAAAAVSGVPAGQRAVRFIRAGGDLVLTIRPSDAAPMSAALLSAAHASPSFDRLVTAAARRVVASKYRAGLMRCPGAP